MANGSDAKTQEEETKSASSDDEEAEEKEEGGDDDDSEESDSDDSDDSDDDVEVEAGKAVVKASPADKNVRALTEAMESSNYRKELEEKMVRLRDPFDFPHDREGWREEDLKELWADCPFEMEKPGWDPAFADEEDWEIVEEEDKEGNELPIAPFYLPYRKFNPVIPSNHTDISSPKSVIEELDRIEEFLKWVSYIFPDRSWYEGTVWDDLAHGKGVFSTRDGLVRYEGEWLQNVMSGHGVVEVDIPDFEPKPGSKQEAKMRAEGKIISRDFMSPEDRKWLEMDIEDSIELSGRNFEIPFYEREEWVKLFGRKPEKGRYKYAGQWKHGRMHGCGVYEVNNRITFGRFYFGEHLKESAGCDADISMMHAGIAEVAAAKARMFLNKPDGMVREDRGPYNDPLHPYMYEEDDAWMAPGFINQFYEVPDFWKVYVDEVDKEREMWLNSFHKSPLRIPMPAELEYWWATDQSPEFILINRQPKKGSKPPLNLEYAESPLILHTRTGKIINYIEDEEHGIRLFWQPEGEDGEEVDMEKVEFLPLGYEKFFGRTLKKKESQLTRFMTKVDKTFQPFFEWLGKWTEEKRKEGELKRKLVEHELEFVEAEISLEEAIEDMEMELKMKLKEEEKKAMIDEKAEDGFSSTSGQEKLDVNADEEEEEEEDEESPASFGSVVEEDQGKESNSKDDKKGSTPFASLSLPFASFSLTSVVPSVFRESFLSWRKDGKSMVGVTPDFGLQTQIGSLGKIQSVHFPRLFGSYMTLRAAKEHRRSHRKIDSLLQLRSLARILSGSEIPKGLKATTLSTPKTAPHQNPHEVFKQNLEKISSLSVPLDPSEYYTANFT